MGGGARDVRRGRVRTRAARGECRGAELRLLVALLRDRHAHINLTGVRVDIGNAFDKIYEANKAFIRTTPESGDIPVRLTITFARFISAIARSHDRSHAEPSDVDDALEYVNLKLDFLKMTAPAPTVRRTSGRANPADWVGRHAGSEVKTQQIVDEYEADTGAAVSERTVRRAVQNAGGKWVGKGVYVLPPPPGMGYKRTRGRHSVWSQEDARDAHGRSSR